jgi:hypothetical protein
MDPKFDKSYGRLLINYLKSNRIHEANACAEEMKLRFNEGTRNKYKEYFDLLAFENEKADNELKKRMRKGKVNYKQIINLFLES